MGKEATAVARSSRKRPGSGSGGHDDQLKKKAATSAAAIAIKKPARELVMSNKLIIDKIAEELPTQLLWVLRSTCTLWNGAFIPQLKEYQSKILFNGKSRSLIDLIPVIQSSSDNPFTSYTFALDRNRGDSISSREADCFPNFISAIGYNIKHLDLIWKRGTDLSICDLRQIIFELTPNLTHLGLTSEDNEHFEAEGQGQRSGSTVLPKLKQFGVAVIVVEDSDWINVALAQLTSDVIQAASGLEILALHEYTNSLHFMEPTIADLFSNITTQSHIHKLKTLELVSRAKHFHMSGAIRQSLLDLGARGNQENGNGRTMQLESFDVPVLCCTELEPGEQDLVMENFRLLYSFLATQSPTLRQLAITFALDNSNDSDSPLFPCRIPQMEQLDNLKLFGCGLGNGEVEFGGTTFANTFPKLKLFLCEYAPVSKLSSDLPDLAARFHHPGVTEFIWSLECHRLDACSNFTNFRPVFPLLNSLNLIFTSALNQDRDNDGKGNIHIDIHELAKVWTTWPALTALHITWKVDDLDIDLDAFVSGVPRKRLDQLRYEHGSLFPGFGFVGVLDNNTLAESLRTTLIKHNKARPGLGDLKQLREFSITFEDTNKDNTKTEGNDYPRLTDMGGYCGIALASHTLQEVVIQGSGKNLLSESCLEYIRSKFGILAQISL